MQFAQIERQRAAREELERIEDALAARLEKTPQILEGGHPSARIGALAALEARALVDRYSVVYETLEPVSYTKLDREEAIKEYKSELIPVSQPGTELGNVTHHAPSNASIDASGAASAQVNVHIEATSNPIEPNVAAQELAETECPVETKYNLLSKGIDVYRCNYTKHINIDTIFTPSEHYGRFLDLHRTHALLASIEPMSYIEYLETFPQLQSPLDHLKAVDAYLTDFFLRTRVFEDPPQPKISSNLYCEPCQRHYATQGVFDGHLKGRKHKRALKSHITQPDEQTLRARISAYTSALQETLADTITDIKRQAALTDKERRAEVESLARRIQNENEGCVDPQAVALQPTTVRERLGPDGKPIPQWLYKLRGLGHEFECQVCGNYVYHGRLAFDRHFDEMRHTHGLKCLGIEAQPLYRGITEIKQVQELAAKQRKKRSRDDAEVEDAEGNVMTERVYQDLKKQNLI